MSNRCLYLIVLSLGLVSLSGFAADQSQALKFEVLPYKNTQVYCENDDNILVII